jgi:hypothetical protein
MLITIDKKSNIFDTMPFIKDEVVFNLFYLIKDEKNLFC